MNSIIKSYNIDGYNLNVENYQSSIECVKNLKERKITDSNFNNVEQNSGSSDWTGVRNYKEALDLFENGWENKVSEVNKILTNNNLKGVSKRISFKNDVIGYAPIVPLAIQGVPEAMVNTSIKKIKSRVIDIVYNNSFLARVDNEKILELSKKIVSVIYKLEMEGYRINLYVLQCYMNRSGADCLMIKMKDSKQHFDLRKMMFPLAHTAFFRVLGFDWYSKFPKGTYRSGYGHGFLECLSAGEITKSQFSKIKSEIFGENSVLIIGQNYIDNKSKDLEEDIKNVREKDN